MQETILKSLLFVPGNSDKKMTRAQGSGARAGFSPDEAEVAHAQAGVKVFENANGAGTAQPDGKMLDKPHLTQALRLLLAAPALAS